MMHRLLLTFLSALWLTTAGLTQVTDHARMANPFSHARTTASIGDEYVWIMDAVVPYLKAYPLFQRWNAEGEIVMEKRILLPPSFAYYFDDISIYDMVVRGDEILAIGAGHSPEMSIKPCLLLLNADGDLLYSGGPSFWYSDGISHAQPLQEDAIFPLVMVRKNWGSEEGIYRMDSININPTKINGHHGISSLALDPIGRLLAGYRSGALCVVDPLTGELMDTLLHAPSSNFLIGFPNDNSFYVVGDEYVALHNMDGTEIISAVLPGKGFRSAFYQDQLLYIMGDKGAMHILDANLQSVRSFWFTHGGYHPQHFAPGKDRHWVIGNDKFGAFRIPMEADGDIPYLAMDVALENIQAGVLTLHPSNTMYFPFRFDLEVSDMQLTVRNLGADTLQELEVIWFVCSFIVFDDIGDVYRNYNTLNWNDLMVPPGETVNLTIPDSIYVLNHYFDKFSMDSYCLEWCMEVQTPNLRMDFNRTNDRYCIPINIASTSIENPDDRYVLSVAPNPSRGEILLSGWENGDVHIQVTNTLGVSVMEKAWTGSGEVRLDTSSWPAGIYHVKVADTTTGKGGIARLVVQD